MYQSLAWQLSLALMGALLVGFLFVAWRARQPVDDHGPLISRAYRVRAALFWSLLLVVTPVMLYSLVELPYADAAAGKRDARVIDVVGRQWSWTLNRNDATVGNPVEFRVTSDDVNHGLGIYDPDMRLVAQTMAMPGYVNTLRHTFTVPGTYRMLCLEYCGLIHHDMIAELHVRAAAAKESVHD